ncbi:peptide-methionine (S)-S-oxide reductase [Arenibacter palladensis]|uniref:Peptide methionine sulfoxide reductase MsrA n=1 Tax=Arenibacter palladensis TaxID=237373 RepID=A0A1M5AQT9_9FLAO|nr:peptide-methionine (S)-S-oxide reductase MsrA [Arenibacter palladensis]SHF32534.1 peptide-methionine (S)-S-oxide reductase [Arenibacter palladensis]
MKLLQITLFTILGFSAINCQSKTKSEQKHEIIAEVSPQELQKYETAYFASGCFWCVEAIFESVKGVKEVVSGYSGGKEKNPTYEQVGYGRTTHAEAVEVYYDPKIVSFETLVKVFFGSHDPTTLNRQGPDKGAQYRSIAFYKNESEKKIINDYISELENKKVYSAPIVTEVKPFSVFYDAEDYHQDYEKNNPNNSYIRNVSVPRLKRFQAKFPELLKNQPH